MSVAVKTVAPSHAHKSLSSSSSSFSPPRSHEHRTVNDIVEKVQEAEVRSLRPRSHAGSVVLADRHPRSVDDINAEIAALEAEARAKNFDRKAFEARDLAQHIRDRSPGPEYDFTEERKVYPRRSRYEEDIVFPARKHRHEDDVVLHERSRSLSRRRWEDIYVTPPIRRDDYVVYERRRSPPRNIIRVEKDRKGRLALVRSAH